MKKTAFLLTVTIGVLAFTSCSKKDCVCTNTVTTAGTVTATTTDQKGSGLSSSECDAYDASATAGTSSTVIACELE